MECEISQSKTWVIPKQRGLDNLSGVITGIGNVLVFPCKVDKKDHSSTSLNVPVHMQFMERRPWLWGRFQRKLVNESVGTFLSIQKIVQESNCELKPFLVKKCREYRSMVQACVAEMNQFLETSEKEVASTVQEDPEELKLNCELLYKMELVLGVIEIIFIDTQPGGVILNQIVNWIRLHFPQCRQRMAECLLNDQPILYPHYWDTVYGLVLQGLLDEARELLSRHPNSNIDCFLSMDEILRKMPKFMAYSGVSEAEFNVRWQHWQSECENRLQNGEFTGCAQLTTICKILCGDQDTMLSLIDVLDTWYHLMVSQLLYSNPTVKLHRLAAAAKGAILAFGMDSHISALDQLLLAIFEINDHLVMKQIQLVLDNLWFTVHVSDLLYHTLEKSEMNRYLHDIRESLIIDYGCELVSHSSLWQLGLLYLERSGGCQSIPIVKIVLQRLPLTDDKKAMKVLHAAMERNLDLIAMGVCRVMGRKTLQQGNLGSAIWWGVRSQDAAFTSHLAHKILMKYMEDGRFESSSLLDHLGPSMLLSDTLTFLGKYREFHTLYQEGDMKSAASLLVSLIASRLAPEYFWPILLEDALPLLQSPEPVITADQTYKLMYCLHNLSISTKGKLDVGKDKEVYASFYDKEADVRLALTNNLARAIIQEGTIGF